MAHRTVFYCDQCKREQETNIQDAHGRPLHPHGWLRLEGNDLCSWGCLSTFAAEQQTKRAAAEFRPNFGMY